MKVRDINEDHYKASPSKAETESESISESASPSLGLPGSETISISSSASPSEEPPVMVSGSIPAGSEFHWFVNFLNQSLITTAPTEDHKPKLVRGKKK